MNITYETVFDGERTSWGNRVAGDLAAVTFAEAANELVAEIAATPQRLRPAVDEIRLWHGASAALPTRDPDLVQQVPA